MCKNELSQSVVHRWVWLYDNSLYSDGHLESSEPRGSGVDTGVVRVGCTPKGEQGRYRGDEGGMHAQGGAGSIQG